MAAKQKAIWYLKAGEWPPTWSSFRFTMLKNINSPFLHQLWQQLWCKPYHFMPSYGTQSLDESSVRSRVGPAGSWNPSLPVIYWDLPWFDSDQWPAAVKVLDLMVLTIMLIHWSCSGAWSDARCFVIVVWCHLQESVCGTHWAIR